jgi:hypothetical protein
MEVFFLDYWLYVAFAIIAVLLIRLCITEDTSLKLTRFIVVVVIVLAVGLPIITHRVSSSGDDFAIEIKFDGTIEVTKNPGYYFGFSQAYFFNKKTTNDMCWFNSYDVFGRLIKVHPKCFTFTLLPEKITAVSGSFPKTINPINDKGAKNARALVDHYGTLIESGSIAEFPDWIKVSVPQ